MRTNKDFILRNVAGETVIVPTGQATQKFNGLITVNEVAAFIWENLDNAESEEKLTQLILDEFEIDEETARTDVKGFLSALLKNGMAVEE